MRHELRLTDIGEGLEEAEIIAWRVAVGQVVHRDEAIIEVMTDKSNAELPAPASGTIVELSGGVGDLVHVGDLLAVIDDGADAPMHRDENAPEPGGGSLPADAPGGSVPERSADPPAPPGVASPTASADAARQKPQGTAGRPKASPSTRRAAARRGIDLSTIVGSGPGGRILLADLDRRVQPTPLPPAAGPPLSPATAAPSSAIGSGTTSAAVEPGTVTPLRGIRRAIAHNMAQSWSEIPHIHAWREIDAQPLLDMRSRLQATERPGLERITPLSFFVAATASALVAHPVANASIDVTAETITTHPSVNVGIAVATERGLIVPVIHQAEQLDLAGTATAIASLVDRARSGASERSDLTGGTVTVTNFGSLGGDRATPLIRPPESLIVGFGGVAERPFVIDGSVVARNTMTVVVGADHRLLDGDVVTAVLNEICQLLIEPLELVLG